MLLLSCSDISEDDFQSNEDKVERALMSFTDTTVLDLYDGSTISWIVKTAYLERWEGSDLVYVKPVVADIFDSLGKKSALLRADSGILDSKLSFISAYGHVYAITPVGASIRADSLIWNKKDDRVRTESSVRVITPKGDMLSGIGFISDTKLENWQILSGVSAIFQNAEDRTPKEELESSNKKSESISGAGVKSKSSTPKKTKSSSIRKVGVKKSSVKRKKGTK